MDNRHSFIAWIVDIMKKPVGMSKIMIGETQIIYSQVGKSHQLEIGDGRMIQKPTLHELMESGVRSLEKLGYLDEEEEDDDEDLYDIDLSFIGEVK